MKNLTVITLILWSLIFSCATPDTKQQAQEAPASDARNDLPKMTVITQNQSQVNLHELKGSNILILFQPDCDHCQREAEEIRQHLDQFKNYDLYFISADQMPAIEAFAKAYDLAGHSNVKFATTTVENVLSNFGAIPAPSVYIYSDRKLIKKFNGEVGIDAILQAI
jgi:peroxiredoxin